LIKIEALTQRTLKEAVDLVNIVFPDQGEEPANIGFPASLNPEKYKDFLSKTQILLSKIQIPELRYWVAIDDSGRVVGTIGLYCYEKDKEEAYWLGWFCVDPATRKQGVGTRLLRFCIEKTKKQGKKFLRLWTTTDPNELDAHRLYEKYGFKLVREEQFGDTALKKLYYELKLEECSGGKECLC